MFEQPPKDELQKIPYKFRYAFQCDHASCRGHLISCIDWEMAESYRKWHRTYGAAWEPKFREKYEAQMILSKDTHFYVGTMRGQPNAWIIVGLFYPPRDLQGELI
jgi:hypothetical protein